MVLLSESGGHWSRIGEGVSEQDNFGLYAVMLMLVFDTFFYSILSLYLERIIPSPFGLRKPWYYIFLPSEWGIGKTRMPVPDEVFSKTRNDADAFENEPQNVKVGIEIRNLSKEFAGVTAVAGMNLKMYEGQITALLGQNGAGKTTTMSMLTGMFAPTSGTAFVNGFNIRTEMEKVRNDLALCPQHNMLFNQLSVKENLIFFGRLSGLHRKEAELEVGKLLKQLRLEDKQNSLSMTLSGGQKRKLSLGCALITGSKVVILDEPTSGLDVENRRMLWDLLLEFRIGRTIVLTTHFMEEADVLGDRIAIMDQGELICAGTPMFLKNYYGTGYILKLSVDSSHAQHKILEVVRNYTQEASISRQGTSGSHELAITIPSTSTSKFPNLFMNLSARKDEVGIQNFGLAQTTMDDVFVRVGEINSALNEEDSSKNVENENSFGEFAQGSNKKITGRQLVFQQFWILSKKRILYAIRRPLILLAQVIIPVVLTIGTILITNSRFPDQDLDSREPALSMTIGSYNDPITPFNSTQDDMAHSYEAVVGGSAELISHAEGLEAYLLSVGENDLNTYRSRYIVGAEINDTKIKAMFSRVATHSFPLTVSLAMSSLLQYMTSKPLTLEVTNHPFYDDSNIFWSIAYTDALPPLVFMTIIPIGLALLAATFVILPIEERRSSAKQLQLMTGLDATTYWSAFFFFDFIFLIGVCGIMLACFPILEDYKVFTANGGGGVAFLILVAYAFQVIPFVYLTSLVSKSIPGGFSLVTIICVLSSGGLTLVLILMMSLSEGTAEPLTYFARLLPGYSVSNAMSTFCQTSLMNVQCSLLTEDQMKRICLPREEGWGWGKDVRECCEECGQEGFPDCFKLIEYMQWASNGTYFPERSYPGIGQDLFFMFLMSFIYTTILISTEKGVLRILKKQVAKASEFFFARKTRDEDVIQENNRVTALVSNNKTEADALVVNNFSKQFGELSAISNVSFGVHHGECFGLLGVNGAGKTTTFRILTGDEAPSVGNAFTGGSNLEGKRASFLKNMGYCPQFDGIVGVLTGNEMLEIFGGLRGIPRKAISQEVSKWMSKMGLSKSGKIECRNYSGGMKRRLSSAMAMIGEPKIILLDEPTTGVDPVARRSFWKIITSLKNAGQAIVLTSHSMEECEKLCTRLAIMVNGEFQCLGGVQHLKDKFAKGYSLTIKLISLREDITPIRLKGLKQKVVETFTPCSLKDEHQNILEYHLTNTNLEWAFLFARMESLRSEFRDILEDYTINQTTLEEVFLAFARQQYPERKAKVSRCRNLCSCLSC